MYFDDDPHGSATARDFDLPEAPARAAPVGSEIWLYIEDTLTHYIPCVIMAFTDTICVLSVNVAGVDATLRLPIWAIKKDDALPKDHKGKQLSFFHRKLDPAYRETNVNMKKVIWRCERVWRQRGIDV